MLMESQAATPSILNSTNCSKTLYLNIYVILKPNGMLWYSASL